ncbi:MAG: HesA/MoeB/ThiF family protein [Sandaracinaceae bacterium]|nr:HesA/MoeB/ThiF family protein [Sandaracinaceae bacterium]
MSDARVLLVGAGGLGSPAALVLARSGVRRLTLIDDDQVDLSNLHRQVLYDDGDVGHSKVHRAAKRLEREGATVEVIEGRLLPPIAVDLVGRFDLVIEGADNFATKFLTSDACQLAGVPVVQAGAVRWAGWALASLPGRSACLRCVFEDIPRDRVETCAVAGVVGAVVGVLGALEAALAIRLLHGDETAAGELWSYRALAAHPLRASRVRPRAGCSCRERTLPDPLTVERYAPPPCTNP